MGTGGAIRGTIETLAGDAIKIFKNGDSLASTFSHVASPAPKAAVPEDAYTAAKNTAETLSSTQGTASNVIQIVQHGDSLLTKVAAIAPAEGTAASVASKAASYVTKATPYVEDLAPIVAKAAIPIAVIAGGAQAVSQFAHGHALAGSETLGKTSGAIAGGLAGAEGGALLGTMLCPGIGTAIGGAAGGLVGGIAGSAAGKYVGGWIHEGVVDVKNAFSNAAAGVTRNLTAQMQLQQQIAQSNAPAGTAQSSVGPKR